MSKIEQLPTKRRSILVGAFILIAYGILVISLLLPLLNSPRLYPV